MSQPRGGVDTHRLERSLGAMTIGMIRGQEERRRRVGALDARELDQHAHLEIAGLAVATAVYTQEVIPFEVRFLDAPDRRHSALAVPHMTFGSRKLAGGQVMIDATVLEYLASDAGQIHGARVEIGIVAPGAVVAVPFRREVHLAFQGYAYPDIPDGDE